MANGGEFRSTYKSNSMGNLRNLPSVGSSALPGLSVCSMLVRAQGFRPKMRVARRYSSCFVVQISGGGTGKA
jgi:hypothetical protein